MIERRGLTMSLIVLLLAILPESHARNHRILSSAASTDRSHRIQTDAYASESRIRSESSTSASVQELLLRRSLSVRGGSFPGQLISSIKSSKRNCWALLVISITIEAAATTLNKRAADTKSSRLFAASCILFLTCVGGFNVALSRIDVSIAYALWSALGTVLVSTAGVVFFGESYDTFKLFCIALIISGVVGLNIRDTAH